MGGGDNLDDLHAGHFVAFTAEELPLVEQTVHGEHHAFLQHLPPAVSFRQVTVEGVMHHHQDHRFRSCSRKRGVEDHREARRRRGGGLPGTVSRAVEMSVWTCDHTGQMTMM